MKKYSTYTVRGLFKKYPTFGKEVCNPNPLRSSFLVTEHTSPSGYTIVRSI